MAKYTMELRSLQAEFYAAMQKYPIFDESYREQLNDKIYHALKYREIGYETPELFCEMLEQWMELNMPEYNWLYKSNLIELTPLQRAQINESYRSVKDSKEDSTRDKKDISTGNSNDTTTGSSTSSNSTESSGDSTTTDSGTSTSKSTDNGSSDSNGDSNTYNSDFPQANLGDKEDSNYYTTGSVSTNTNHSESENESSVDSTSNNTTTNNSSNTTESSGRGTSETITGRTYEDNRNSEDVYGMTSQIVNTTERVRDGNEGKTDFELLAEYRKSFVNVDAKLIKALKKELFLKLW